ARLIVAVIESGGPARLNLETGDTRYRIIDRGSRVIYDSGAPQGPQLEEGESPGGPRHNWLYRLGAAILKRPLQWIRPALRPLPSSDAYEQSAILRGKEVQDALLGR